MTARGSGSRKMHLVTDRDGTIIGGFEPGRADDGAVFSIEPMAGQEVREAEVPEEIASLEAGEDFAEAIRDARIEQSGRIVLKRKLQGREDRSAR